MTELVSMLVPLQGTLPFWPTVQEPTAVEVLGLLIGLPALTFVIIAVLGKSKELLRAGRGEADTHLDEPLWLGVAPADRSAITAGDQVPATVPAEGRRAIAPAEVGGTSARW
ncbi:hypothetical protein FOE78_08140 [Microlunatus elymi]|uniref:Uncharacterized protein n=1 Tax=Microlunatus elymi TaxID=2596828 RepID=A0A516PXJ4_9ACTN|nr:hypothetical protein [Microlunatus elymi]QDP95872.1 hypothetical protein FOE78_08140 [Microlunatus elymi]